MAKHLLVSLIGILCGLVSFGQSVTPFVTSPAGDFFFNSNAGASLSFTVGEMTMVETFFANQHFLTQGFQQPVVQVIAVADPSDFLEEFVIFPNPASDYINVRYQLRFPGTITLQMVNLNGVEVMPAYVDRYSGGLREEMLPLEQVSQGMYVLRVRYESPGRGIDHISYHKINIIK